MPPRYHPGCRPPIPTGAGLGVGGDLLGAVTGAPGADYLPFIGAAAPLGGAQASSAWALGRAPCRACTLPGSLGRWPTTPALGLSGVAWDVRDAEMNWAPFYGKWAVASTPEGPTGGIFTLFLWFAPRPRSGGLGLGGLPSAGRPLGAPPERLRQGTGEAQARSLPLQASFGGGARPPPGFRGS